MQARSPGAPPTTALRRVWRASVASIPTAALLAVTVTATPVLADCTAVNAAFPPGGWSGHVANISTQSDDGLSVAVTDATGGFDLVVSQTGEVEGAFSFEGTGHADMAGELDEGSSAAQWRFTAQAGGSPTLVTLDGEAVMAVETIIDVHTSTGGPDPYSGTGQDLYDHRFETTSAWASELEPRTQDCRSVSGEMTAPVGFDTDTVEWYAVRMDGLAKARIDGLEEQLVNLLDQAERILGGPEFDAWVFSQFLYDMLRFDGLLNSLEGCNPDNVHTYGPAWDLLQSVSLNTMRTFLVQAEAGEYATRDVVRAMSMFLQSGVLGWRGSDGCVAPTSDETAHDLFTRFEDLLITRWHAAVEAGDNAAMTAIWTAAVHFGFPRLHAAMNGV
jgi:hypothetical protein